MRTSSLGMALLALILIGTRQAAAEKAFIVKDGKPMAEIVVAEKPPRMTTLAAKELQAQLQKMSGAELPIVTELADAYPVKVYVGKSEFTNKLGVTDEGLSHGAFHMKSGQNYLILLGKDVDFEPKPPIPTSRNQFPKMLRKWDEMTGSTYLNPTFPFYKRHNKATGIWLDDEGGTFNAVTAFLRSLGCRWYMPGPVGEVIPERKTIPLPAIDETVKADFPARVFDWGNYGKYTRDEVLWGRRLGLNNNAMGGPHGLTKVHGRREMRDAHPEYYSLYGNKRDTEFRNTGHGCYSSDELAREAVAYSRAIFDHLDFPAASIMPQDGYHPCQCPRCAGKSPSELVWNFVNKVAKELHKTHPDRLVIGGAYTAYVEPPDSIDKFSPNVAVRISWHRTGFDNPENWKRYWNLVEKWNAKLAPGRLIRNANYLTTQTRGGKKVEFPILFPHNISKDMRALKGMSLGERSSVPRGPGDYWQNPGINHLNLYVLARHLWDADQDLDAILDEYYETFYGPADKEMKAAFEFAEAKVPRLGRASPARVPYEDRIKLLELLQKARDAAGDTIYGKRVQLIMNEMPTLEESREALREKIAAGDPRKNAPVAAARDANNPKPPSTYKLKNLITGEEADIDTTFTATWTDGDLVFDIRCEDPDMEHLFVTSDVYGGDSAAILLETPNHSYYQLEFNPDGVLFDADRENGRLIKNWKSQAKIETERGKDFWRAKVRIPVLSVEKGSMDPFHNVVGDKPTKDKPWFFNVGRVRNRDGKRSKYAFSPTGSNYHKPLKFGKLVVE